MAIHILNHMDLVIGTNKAEIRNVRIHNVAEGSVSNPGVGQIIYDSGTLKYYNGSAFVSLGTSNATGDITGVDISVGTGLDISSPTAISRTVNLDLTEVGLSATANQLLTDDGDGTITSEANATYDGTDLKLTSGTSAAGGGASALNDLSDVTYSSGD